VVELVDTHDSNSCSARSVGSIPTSGTDDESSMSIRMSGFFIIATSPREEFILSAKQSKGPRIQAKGQLRELAF